MGKRHDDTDIRNPKAGVAYLAGMGLPVIPIKINGIANMRLRDFLTGKRKATIVFGKPIFFDNLSHNKSGDCDIEKYKTMSRHIMRKIAVLRGGN